MNVKAVMAIAMFTLVAALLIPTFVTASDSNQTVNVELTEGETTDVTDRLTVRADEVNPSGDNATLTVINQDSLSRSQKFHNDTETKTYTVDGYDTTITLDNTLRDSDDRKTSRLEVVYNPYFGWNEGAAVFFSNLGLIFAILGGIMILGLLAVATDW